MILGFSWVGFSRIGEGKLNRSDENCSRLFRLFFVLFFFLESACTPAVAAPVPIPPSSPQAPSVSHFSAKKDTYDAPRLLLLHDFPLEKTEGEDAARDALTKAREHYFDLLKYIERESSTGPLLIHPTSLPLVVFPFLSLPFCRVAFSLWLRLALSLLPSLPLSVFLGLSLSL